MKQRCNSLLPSLAAVFLLGTSVPAWAVLPTDAPTSVPIKDTDYPIPGAGVYYVAPNGRDTNFGTDASSPWTVAKALVSAPEGSTIVFRGGTYRSVNDLNVDKRLTLQAYPHEQPWIKGSQIVTGWVRDGSLWVKTGWTVEFPGPAAGDPDILSSYPLAGNRDQVYINNQPKTQVGSRAEVGPGKFFVDYALDKIHIGDDPASKTVEVTTFANGFNLNGTPSTPVHTAILGLGFAHYADQAIQVFAQRTLLENNTFAWNGLQGVRFRGGGWGAVKGNLFSCNGRGGMGASRAHGILVENNTFRYNNVENFNSYSAAGVKLIFTNDMVLRNNIAERTYNSMGIWIDISSVNSTVVKNTCRYNGKVGIFMEISHQALIAFNVCHNNDTGIYIEDSSSARLYNNTLVANGRNLEITDTSDTSTNQDDIDRGITLISRNHVVKNNLLANPIPIFGDGDQIQFHAWNVETNDVAGDMFTGINYNGYVRDSTTSAPKVIRWTGSATLTYGTNYLTLAAFRQPYPQYEPNGLAVDNAATNPVFIDEANKDFRLHPNSAAINRGDTLPQDVADAAGEPISPVHLGALDPIPSPRYETETLAVAATSGDTHRVITGDDFAGGNGTGTILEANAANDFVSYTVYAPEARTYKVTVGVKKRSNRGVFQMAVMGTTNAFTNHGTPQDLYGAAEQFVTLDVATVTFGSAGNKQFRFTVTGKNASSSGYSLAFDHIQLTPQ